MSDEWTIDLVDLGHALGPNLTPLPDRSLGQLTEVAATRGPAPRGLGIDGPQYIVR